MSPLRVKMQAWIDELIQISDVVLLNREEATLFSGYKEAFAKARKRQKEIKEEVFATLQFEAMKSKVGGAK